MLRRLNQTGGPRIGILLTVAAALLLRLWALDRIPPGFHFDESFEGLEAWQMLVDSSYRPLFFPGNFGVPVGFAYLNVLTFWLFEQLGGEAGPLAMRATAAVAGVMTVLVLMGTTRELGRYGLVPPRAAIPVALAAAASLAGMRWHIHFSRMGIEPILGPLLWAGTLWLLLDGWRTGRRWVFVLCGIATAAPMYVYQAIWIIPLIIGALALYLLLVVKNPTGEPPTSAAPFLRRRVTGLAIAGLTATLLVLPLALYFVQAPDLLLLRPGQVTADVDSGNRIVQNTLATAGMFLPFGSGDLDPRRNIPGAPALNTLWSLAFLAGVIVSILRIRKPAWIIVWLSLIGLLLPGILTEYAPHFHRILAASAPTAILVGVGIWALAQAAQRLAQALTARPLTPAVATAIMLLLLTIGGAWDARDYFVRWATRPDLYHAFDEGLWQVGRWISQQNRPAVFISPRGAEHPTLAFAWRNQGSSSPVRYDGRHVFPLRATGAQMDETPSDETHTNETRTDETLYVVIEHEDFRSPLLLSGLFTEIEPLVQFTDRAGDLYASAYLRPASAELARAPQVPLDSPMVDGIRLLGYDLLPESPRPGDILYVQLYWQTDSAPTRDWTVYNHLLAQDDGRLVAGHDAQPGQGSLPTTAWAAGWIILDEHQIWLPPETQNGMYTLVVGLYPSGQPDDSLTTRAELGTIQMNRQE